MRVSWLRKNNIAKCSKASVSRKLCLAKISDSRVSITIDRLKNRANAITAIYKTEELVHDKLYNIIITQKSLKFE